MAKVIRVYGKADSYDIEFTPNGDKWEVDIPPDMTDGVYACQLTAIDELGECAYWVGELYMVGGVCCLKINEIPYKGQLKPKEYGVELQKRKYKVSWCSSSFDIKFDKKYNVQLRKNKACKSNYETRFFTTLTTSEAATQNTLTLETKRAEILPKTELNTEFTPKTEIFIGKGCHCYGGK
jgi:hypothetical protein